MRDVEDVHVEDDDQSEQRVLEVDQGRERVLGLGGERLELRLGTRRRHLRIQGGTSTISNCFVSFRQSSMADSLSELTMPLVYWPRLLSDLDSVERPRIEKRNHHVIVRWTRVASTA